MKIKLHPIGTEIAGDPNKTVLQICMENKIELKSLCKGTPSCAECRVKLLAGENNVIPPTKSELGLIGTSYYIDGRRLACQLRAFGDISLDITEHLTKDEVSAKKVRGFQVADRNFESKAVQGTLLLQEAGTPPSSTESSAKGKRNNR
ncbi:MAG: hypothetical protein C5B49_15515 [Bdellovibrio sp.]|nr:MAG: hypothetical protein C5B49_15515 [Bdellovibrio sp.]